MKYEYHNFYIKGKIEILDKQLPISDFLDIEEDNINETIPQYLERVNHTIERFSDDGFFIKGFGFKYEGLKRLEEELSLLGFSINSDYWILSEKEVLKELELTSWQKESLE